MFYSFYIIIIHDFPRLAISILSTRVSRIGANIWNSIPDSDRAVPEYKFKNTLQCWLLNILMQEDTYVDVCTLVDIFSKYSSFSLISCTPCFIYLF